jgi:formylglycine-generating enzyme required for sulfatase activity
VRGALAACLAIAGLFWAAHQYRQHANFTNGLLDHLVDSNIERVPNIIAELEGHRRWVNPKLTEIVHAASSSEQARLRASLALLSVDPGQVEYLSERLLAADPQEFLVLGDALIPHKQALLEKLWATVEPLPNSDAQPNEKLAKRQANAAVALLRMDRSDKVWPLLKHGSDPTMRSYLIHRLGPLGTEASAILKRLDEETDVSVRRALVLSLGEFGEGALPLSKRNAVIEKLQELYRTAADPGLHAAAEWLLRQWQQGPWLKQWENEWRRDKKWRRQRMASIRQEFAKPTGEAQPQWYVNREGQTMVVLPGPVEFRMGSPPTEAARNDDEPLHLQRIGRSFAIASKPVTLEQYLRFYDEHPYTPRFVPKDDCPVIETSWYEAAEYCNWLSEQEGLPRNQWCYVPNKVGEYENGMRLAPDYLKRTGYRLPTEAEWEYACRAGARTSWYYGESEEMLEKYGVYARNSGVHSWPVGSLKPNDLGFFDLHGNVFTWCQERYKEYAAANDGTCIEDHEDVRHIDEEEDRVVRGGSFFYPAADLRCADRTSHAEPTRRDSDIGFRVARTFR